MAFVTEQQAKMTLNLGLHVVVLATFLFAAFYVFLAKITVDLINTQVTDGIDDNADGMLDHVAKKFGKSINWDVTEQWAKNLINTSQGRDPAVTESNNRLFDRALGILIGLVVAWVATALVFRYWMKYDIGLWSLLAENAIVFTLIGAFEAYFMMTVATKYVPLSASVSMTTALERLKKNLDSRVTAIVPISPTQVSYQTPSLVRSMRQA